MGIVTHELSVTVPIPVDGDPLDWWKVFDAKLTIYPVSYTGCCVQSVSDRYEAEGGLKLWRNRYRNQGNVCMQSGIRRPAPQVFCLGLPTLADVERAIEAAQADAQAGHLCRTLDGVSSRMQTAAGA